MWFSPIHPKDGSPLSIALKLGAAYLAVSIIWILFSDWLLYEILPLQDTPLAQTVNAVAYLLLSAIMLALLTYRWTRHFAEIDGKYEESLVSTVKALSKVLEKDDEYTANHSIEVSNLAGLIVQHLGYSADRQRTVELAALVHDIGKVGVPNKILSKPGPLTDEEFAYIRKHPGFGYEVLSVLTFNAPIPEIVLQHHERRDGSGYPYGLVGYQILEEAEIVAVADVFVSMAHARPYRAALGLDVALAELNAGSGIKYHPAAVKACERIVRSPAYVKVPAKGKAAQPAESGSDLFPTNDLAWETSE